MRMLFRALGMFMVTIFMSMTVLYVSSVNIHQEELLSTTTTALNQTQMVMEDQIMDNLYGTEIADTELLTDESYFNFFLENLRILVSSSDSKYTVDLLDIDVDRGFIRVKVTTTFNTVAGVRTKEVIKTGLVDVRNLQEL